MRWAYFLFSLASLLLIPGVGFTLEPMHSGAFRTHVIGKVGKGEPVFPLPWADIQSRPAGRLPRAIPSAGSERPRAVPAVRRSSPRPSPKTQSARPASVKRTAEIPRAASRDGLRQGRLGKTQTPLPSAVERIVGGPLGPTAKPKPTVKPPRVRAKALYCLDCTNNKVVLAQNTTTPLPIASITKLLTAMTVIDLMDLDRIVEIPEEIRRVPKHRVGIRAKDRIRVRDLLHGMLIESGNDCAEALAMTYPKGGREAFIKEMNRKAALIGAKSARIYTPSGLDLILSLGVKDGRVLVSKRPNVATARDVAIIAKKAFQYPLIRQISSMKTHVIRGHTKRKRKYVLRSNDRLLFRPLPVAGAKTGYTNLAGRCIVAHFKDEKEKRDYMVVVLNTRRHFQAAERIYKWACKTF